MPEGTIIAWSGSTLPAGWPLCDGGTLQRRDHPDFVLPDLVHRFPRGGALGTRGTGGADPIVLDREQLPAHYHDRKDIDYAEKEDMMPSGATKFASLPDHEGVRSKADTDNVGWQIDRETEETGRDRPLDIRPKYTELAYITLKSGWTRRT